MTHPVPTTPSTIVPCRVDREIGRGGMGVELRAHGTRLGFEPVLRDRLRRAGT